MKLFGAEKGTAGRAEKGSRGELDDACQSDQVEATAFVFFDVLTGGCHGRKREDLKCDPTFLKSAEIDVPDFAALK